jgi:hypothetical protein
MVYEAHKTGGASAGPVVSSSGKLLVYLRDWRGETAIEEVEEAGGGSAGQWKVVEQLAREGRRELEPFAAQFYRLRSGTGDATALEPTGGGGGRDWERKESRSQPGKFYYLNSRTGERRWDEPVPPLPLAPAEPPEAVKHSTAAGKLQSAVSAFGAATSLCADSSGDAAVPVLDATGGGGGGSGGSGGDWERKESRSQPGKFYFLNSRTGERRWDKSV